MATATSYGVTLNLTQEEAQALATLLYCHVAGKSRVREILTENILGALESSGIYGQSPGFRNPEGTRAHGVVIDR